MERIRKNTIIVFITAFVVFFLMVGLALCSYQAEQTETEIGTYLSDDETYSLTIYQLGEPEWSFGNTHCRFVLCKNQIHISTKDFDIACDGANVRQGNFSVYWNNLM